MSADVVIRAEGLGKKYVIGHAAQAEREQYVALRDVIARTARGFARSTMDMVRGRSIVAGDTTEEFWALRGASFEVKRGEVVGIIGRNGAGKSTLLKILSRITEPSEGRVTIKGRVASLLEVGTGFHPELTGRENIYLNGAILGMTRAEIRRRFDEIVDFAGVERFLDTPVKRYSSGMYVRLAFAVAAHLEAEILLVDEVLAVGDAAFQKRCLGKMHTVANQGRTVFFVSHNLPAIQALCQRALLLQSGELVHQGGVSSVVQSYTASVTSAVTACLEHRLDRSGDGSIRLITAIIENDGTEDIIASGSRLKITIGYMATDAIKNPKILIAVYDVLGSGIFLFDSETKYGLPDYLPREGEITCITEPINLTPGRCYLNVAAFRAGVLADHVESAAYFDVEPENLWGYRKMPSRSWVTCLLGHKWSAAYEKLEYHHR